jgi:acetyl esterase/lipase
MTRRRWALRLWPLAAAVAALVALPAALVPTEQGRSAIVATIFLPDLIFSLPVRPVTWVTPDPVREHVVIQYGAGRTIEADLYRPPSGAALGGVIFSMGAPPLDLDDPRLVKLSEDAARAGFVMLVPFSERLDEELILPEEIDALVGAFRYLQAQPYMNPDRVGYIGVSVGASLALLAAADPRIRDDVDFVVAFGGYYDALDTFVALASRRIEYDGLDEPWTPRWHSIKVMARQFIYELDDPYDREVLTAAFVNRKPVTQEQIAGLSPDGRAVYDFLTSAGDPARARRLIVGLPPDAVARLRALSPSQAAGDLRTEVFIVHDRGDEFIPYVESRRLRDALVARTKVHFDEVRFFKHVEPRLNQRSDVLVLDGVRLIFRLYQILLRLT